VQTVSVAITRATGATIWEGSRLAVPTPCQTPGAIFHVHVTDGEIAIRVEVPLSFSEAEAELLDANLHNAIELVLAPFFKEKRWDRS
jgi:hypothetical protein